MRQVCAAVAHQRGIAHPGWPRKLRAVETLRIERQDGVVSITLDRPEKRNAINGVTVSYTHLTLPTICSV